MLAGRKYLGKLSHCRLIKQVLELEHSTDLQIHGNAEAAATIVDAGAACAASDASETSGAPLQSCRYEAAAGAAQCSLS